MSVVAVVVNFNAGDALQRCVESLFEGSLQPRVLVVDNASGDQSAERIRQLHAGRTGLEVVFNKRNLGFARAVNAALERVAAPWVLIINPDCTVGPECVRLLTEALESDPGAALAAPAVRGPDGRLEKAALRQFPDPWNSLVTLLGLWRLERWVPWLKGVPLVPEPGAGGPVAAEAVSGACMLVRRQAVLEVGMLDEGYGLHCEDLDLMYRLHQAGWHCLYVGAADAVHEQGVSSRSRPFWVHRQKHRGMARFFKKFQAAKHWMPVRWLVHAGIWLHYLITLPLVPLRK